MQSALATFLATALTIAAWIALGLILTGIAWVFSRWLAVPENNRGGGVQPSRSSTAVTQTNQHIIAHDERTGS